MKRALALAFMCVLLDGCGGSARQPQRPELQKVLDSLVAGHFRAAPRVAAYVSGPHGTWEGVAGFADIARHIPMRPDVRSCIGSVSKLWTATVVVKLAQEGNLSLDDTVAKWLPNTFPYGNRITIRELLNHTSGMVDDNDIEARPSYWLAKIHDPRLRREVLVIGKASAKNPAITIPPKFEMRVAAALPLLFQPGTDYHYSNIGYKTAAAIAEKAGHAPLADLYRRFIIDPLKLTSAGYDSTQRSQAPTPSATSSSQAERHGRTRARARDRSRPRAESSSTRPTRPASSSRSCKGASSRSRTCTRSNNQRSRPTGSGPLLRRSAGCTS